MIPLDARSLGAQLTQQHGQGRHGRKWYIIPVSPAARKRPLLGVKQKFRALTAAFGG